MAAASSRIPDPTVLDAPTADLEVGANALLAALASVSQAADDTRTLIDNLRAQRDELLAALNGLVGLVQLIQRREPELQTNYRFVDALAAIAKAEGAR
jgi:ABC-type transporter Mla subunit MlaD